MLECRILIFLPTRNIAYRAPDWTLQWPEVSAGGWNVRQVTEKKPCNAPYVVLPSEQLCAPIEHTLIIGHSRHRTQ